MRDEATKKPRSKQAKSDIRPEYDFSGGVRGKYAERYRAGSNLVLLDPEVAEAFPSAKAVNDALRSLLQEREKRRKIFVKK